MTRVAMASERSRQTVKLFDVGVDGGNPAVDTLASASDVLGRALPLATSMTLVAKPHGLGGVRIVAESMANRAVLPSAEMKCLPVR